MVIPRSYAVGNQTPNGFGPKNYQNSKARLVIPGGPKGYHKDFSILPMSTCPCAL